jgi:hypothetical protein
MADVPSPPPSGPDVVVDLRGLASSLGSVRVALDSLAAELRTAWETALAEGDFACVDRIVDASHSVHRAAAALSEDSTAPGMSSAPQAGH